MGDKGKMAVVGLVSLVVGAAVGGGYGMMQVDDVTQRLMAATQEKEQAAQDASRLRKLNDDATKKYGGELGKLVAAAAVSAPAPAAPVTGQPAVTPAADDGTKAIDSARAILALRDGYRASLDGVRNAMDSEMDAMAAELGAATPDAGKIKVLLDSLKMNWPIKEKDLEAATRKLMIDLGLAQAPAAPKPVAAPAAAPAPPAAPAPAPADSKK